MLKLEKIQLTFSEFKSPQDGELKSYCLSLTDYHINSVDCTSGFCCDVSLVFDLFGKEHLPSKLICGWRLRYSGDEDDRDLLKEHIVVAHSIPYLREFAANTLMRAGFPQLLLEPTNAFRLWKMYRETT